MNKRSIAFGLLVISFSFSCSITSPREPDEQTIASPASPTAPTSQGIQPTDPGAQQTPTITAGLESLNPDGPYVLFEGYGGLWIANPDGSYPARISDVGLQNPFVDLHRAISPDGQRLALIRSTDNAAELHILRLPDGESERVIRLADRPGYENMTTPEGLAFHDIVRYDNLAWQPGEGRLLAFVGAMDGPTADLYIYDTVTGEVARLTSGPSQALFPTWSPDGQYILHFGGSWVEPLGGALTEYTRSDGSWAVRVEDGAIITQPGTDYRHTNFLGWIDDGHYLISRLDEACVHRNIDSVAVADAKRSRVFDGCFDGFQGFSPGDGTMLLSSSACGACPLAGTFLLGPGDTEPQIIWGEKAWEIEWLPESGVFDVYPLGAVTGKGQRFDPPVPEPSAMAVSRAGWIAWLALEEEGYRVYIGRPGEETVLLSAALGAMIWDPAVGNTLLGSTDGGVYSATAPNFVLQRVGDLGESADQAIWIP